MEVDNKKEKKTINSLKVNNGFLSDRSKSIIKDPLNDENIYSARSLDEDKISNVIADKIFTGKDDIELSFNIDDSLENIYFDENYKNYFHCIHCGCLVGVEGKIKIKIS